MAWKIPETFGTLPPTCWPVEVVTFAFAMTSQDWVNVVSGIVGTGTFGAILAAISALWEKSSTKKLFEARSEASNSKIRVEELESDLKTEREDRAHQRDRKDAEIKRMQELVESLRVQLADRDRTIAERDEQLRSRDLAIEQNSRNIHLLSKDVAALSALMLMQKGDARRKTP